MKKLIVLVVLVAGFLAGCNGTVDDYATRRNRYKDICELQSRMLVDDMDFILMMDHNSTLTEYHPHVGR